MRVWSSHAHAHQAVSQTTTTIQSGEGSVLTGEELPPISGEKNHALSRVVGPDSLPVSSGHHTSMEHRLRRKHPWVNYDTDASSEIYLKDEK